MHSILMLLEQAKRHYRNVMHIVIFYCKKPVVLKLLWSNASWLEHRYQLYEVVSIF